MSAYSASAPVTARNTAPRMTSARPGCAANKLQRVPGIHGLEHLRRAARSPWRRAPRASTNHSIMMGPNSRPTRAVPRRWIANNATMTPSVTGSTARSKSGFEHLQTFDRAQHRDRRRDQRVAVEQRRAEHAERHRAARPGLGRAEALLDERDQRKDAAFAVIVGAHDHREVLHAHDDGRGSRRSATAVLTPWTRRPG